MKIIGIKCLAFLSLSTSFFLCVHSALAAKMYSPACFGEIGDKTVTYPSRHCLKTAVPKPTCYEQFKNSSAYQSCNHDTFPTQFTYSPKESALEGVPVCHIDHVWCNQGRAINDAWTINSGYVYYRKMTGLGLINKSGTISGPGVKRIVLSH